MPTFGKTDIGDEANGAFGRAEIGVLIHFERQFDAEFLGVAAELADARHGFPPYLRIVGILDAIDRPEPQRRLLRIGQRPEQAEGHGACPDRVPRYR